MTRLILPALLALGACAAQPPAPQAGPRTTDAALLQAFFGAGEQRPVSPVIRCATRCATPP